MGIYSHQKPTQNYKTEFQVNMRKHTFIPGTVAGFLQGGRQQLQQSHKKGFDTSCCSGYQYKHTGLGCAPAVLYAG